MTHHPIRTLEDGTRVYSNGTRYRPVPDELRKYKRHKILGAPVVEPPGPDLLPERQRVMPEGVVVCNRRDLPREC